MDPAHAKQQIRAKMKQVLAEMTDEQKEAESQRICLFVARYLDLHPDVQTIATFCPIGSEPDLSTLHTILPNRHLAYPLCDDEGGMEFYHVECPATLNPGRFGLMEPCTEFHNKVEPTEIDLFLCPAYAYTPDGDRLGKGGGYYDHYLIRRSDKAHVAGVLFSSQLTDFIPVQHHDVTMHRLFHGEVNGAPS